MKLRSACLVLMALFVAGSASASGGGGGGADAPDLRVRAALRAPDDGEWGANESLGNAEFRVHSRYLQLYYGGVHRNDEFKFTVQVDFTGISGFATEFAGSRYNTDYDVYIEGGWVGRAIMDESTHGVAELQYDSRHPDAPALPLPAAFPEPVEVGDVVSIYLAAAVMPEVGDPMPAGAPVFQNALEERFARGDVDQNNRVDEIDFAFLQNAFDPANVNGPHIGPLAGDFTGDNRSDIQDYALFVQNWTESTPVPTLAGVAGVGEGPGAALLQVRGNLPNPFPRSTSIQFRLPAASDVTVDFFNVAGARVASRAVSSLGAGWQSVEFDGRDARGALLPNGTYFYRVAAAGTAVTRKMVLSR